MKTKYLYGNKNIHDEILISYFLRVDFVHWALGLNEVYATVILYIEKLFTESLYLNNSTQ